VGVGKYDRDFTDGYDKVGNRTKMRLINQTGMVSTGVIWNMTYNALNQLTQRYNGTTWANGTERYAYTYDYNGNQIRVTKETYSGGAWTQVERWNYTYNIRNELTQVEKRTGTGSGTYAGKEVYEYCLSCDGALSVWKTYGAGSAVYPTSWRRYEYDGLNLLRMDERCDNDKDGIIEAGETTWRTVEVNTHKPGSLGALTGKRVYVYSDAADSSPNSSNDYTYTYDALGNVQVVYKASGTVGQEAYFFTQDAFGNELSGDANILASNRTNLLGGATWATARAAGISEHQTGKIQLAFSGLQHFGL